MEHFQHTLEKFEDFGLSSRANLSDFYQMMAHGNLSLNMNSTNYSTNYGYLSESDLKFQKIISNLNVYVIPIIIVIGVIGNTISFLVYICTPHLCRQSSSMYLAFLAAVDNGFLVSLFTVWFGWVGIYETMNKNGWCQTIFYSMYVCSFLSVWTVVSFTVERWIVVFHPLKRHQLCTRKRALIVMTCLTLFSLGFYSFSIVTISLQYAPNGLSICMPGKEYHDLLRVITFIDTIITVIVPSLGIIMMNTGIGIKICRYTNKKKQAGTGNTASMDEMSNISVLKTNPESVEFSTRNGTRTSVVYQNQTTKIRSWRFLTKRHHTQIRITRALLIVSSVFVLLNLPSSAFRIQAFILSIKKEEFNFSLKAHVWQEFLQFLYYINFSSNFFLYVTCSRNFRHAFKRLLRRAKHKVWNLSTKRSAVLYNIFTKRQAKN